MKQLRVYIRSGCHLCDAMLAELHTSDQREKFELELVDILGHPELESRYGQQVPVLCTDKNEEICHFFLDQTALAEYFSQP